MPPVKNMAVANSVRKCHCLKTQAQCRHMAGNNSTGTSGTDAVAEQIRWSWWNPVGL
jgi:hypothetical protein